jgi:glycogen debranching enzyme
MQPGANTTYVRYTLKRGTEPLHLSLKALVNYRAVSLPTVDPLPPLLTPAQQQAVVNTCAKMLLTSHGLRALAPTHPDDAGHYRGDPYQRDRTYHQGTVWGWLMGAFVQAHLRVYCDPATALTFLESIADQLRFGCVGTLSEIFDGNSPFSSRGAFAQAWTVAEALRAWRLVQERLISR